MASVWIANRSTKDGKTRYRVEYRFGGRESRKRYAGTFRTKRAAMLRLALVDGEMAAGRVPEAAIALVDAPAAPRLDDAMDAWRESRIDVDEVTRTMHRVCCSRVFLVCPELRSRRIDTLDVEAMNALVAACVAEGYTRETIRKTRSAVAQVLDHYEVSPNPARDKRVKLPKEAKPHIPPPLADHVERVAETLPAKHVVPFLVLDACGPRVSELETAKVSDLDESLRAIRVRSEVEKNERYRHLALPDELFDALVASLPSREDRDPEAPLFPEFEDARVRTAIAKACAKIGVPHYSPHGLRRRRGSLVYKATGSLAEVAQFLGDSKRVASEHYVYALTDYREADRTKALARVR